MSSGGAEPFGKSAAWRRLEEAVQRMAADRGAWRERALAAEERIGELESALRDVSAGRLNPVALAERSRELEAENRALGDRVDRARETVERIMARLQFTQEEP
jgi:hypothetical protein